MLKFSGFHFIKPALLTVAILGLALIAVDASAQSESEKGDENNLKVNDRVLLEDNSINLENNTTPLFTPKPSPAAVKTIPVVRRDLPAGGVIVDKEVKKNESPSTLSFNIFLYIVDKFKAD